MTPAAMTSAAMTELVERLAEAWRIGTPISPLPAHLVPASAAEAYQAQIALVERLAPRLGPIVGWKVGAPDPSAEPNAAPLLADLVQPSPARFPGNRFRLRIPEAELAFRFARPLPPRREAYGEAEVSAAIGSLHPAIELAESRFEDWQGTAPLARLVDLASNGVFCFGAGISDWRGVDYLKQEASLAFDGRIVAEAKGGNRAGHPLRLLVWLADHAGLLGRGIAAGDIVTTGSHASLKVADSTGRVAAVFLRVGEARLDFTP